MVDQNATGRVRVGTMKEHLAGIRNGQLWARDIVANHLQHLAEVYDAVGNVSEPQPPIQETEQS